MARKPGSQMRNRAAKTAAAMGSSGAVAAEPPKKRISTAQFFRDHKVSEEEMTEPAANGGLKNWVPVAGILPALVPGVAEAAELFENMLLVTGFPRIAREVGSEAQLHIQTHHALESIARQYWEVLCEAAVLPSLPR